MEGIKPHTHGDRRRVVEMLVPFLRRRFGSNLHAFGVVGSFARNQDTAYSDIECIVFLKRMTARDRGWEIRKVIDGLLVVVVPDTVESFIKSDLDVSRIWHATGAGKLLPIINKPAIERLNSYVAKGMERKCLGRIRERWPHYQEITAKLLNGIRQRNRDQIAIAFPSMMSELFIILSFLNKTPYVSLGTWPTQARKFGIKPRGIDALLDIYVNGEYGDASRMGKAAVAAFSDLERTLLRKGVTLYDRNL